MGTGRGGGGGSGSGGGSGGRDSSPGSSSLLSLKYSFGNQTEQKDLDQKQTIELIQEVLSKFPDQYFDSIFLSEYIENLYKELFILKTSFDLNDLTALIERFNLTIDNPGFIIDMMSLVKDYYADDYANKLIEQGIEVANSTFDGFLSKIIGDDLSKAFTLNFEEVRAERDITVLKSISGYFLAKLLKEAFIRDVGKIDVKKEIYLDNACEIIGNHIFNKVLKPSLGKTVNGVQIDYQEMFFVFREKKGLIKKILKSDKIPI